MACAGKKGGKGGKKGGKGGKTSSKKGGGKKTAAPSEW